MTGTVVQSVQCSDTVDTADAAMCPSDHMRAYERDQYWPNNIDIGRWVVCTVSCCGPPTNSVCNSGYPTPLYDARSEGSANATESNVTDEDQWPAP